VLGIEPRFPQMLGEHWTTLPFLSLLGT
jgi:hypothetical protein